MKYLCKSFFVVFVATTLLWSCVSPKGKNGKQFNLTIFPSNKEDGFRPSISDSDPWGDAWGASIIKDGDTYHMWVSVMANNCSVEYWSRNSYTIYATSKKAEGPYVYQSDAFPVMSHEVDVRKAPDGTWVAIMTAGIKKNGELGHSGYGNPFVCDKDGVTEEGGHYGASIEKTVLLTADKPEGPWSKPIILIDPASLPDGIDTNLSATINADGSLVGLWRTYPKGSRVHWVKASNYKDPSTYEWQDDEETLFESPYDGNTKEGLEDMFVWKDAENYYHVIFHDMGVLDDKQEFYDGLSHAYSTDGVEWIYTGRIAGSKSKYTDGETIYSARARPQFIFDENGIVTHLISSEQEPEEGRNFILIEKAETEFVDTK